jgi:hypothetical protein
VDRGSFGDVSQTEVDHASATHRGVDSHSLLDPAAVSALPPVQASAAAPGPQAAVRALRPCDKIQPVSTIEWFRSTEQYGFSVQLPTCFQPVPKAPPYVHGGNRWRCGTATVEVVWGSWGSDSFEDREACRATVDGLTVVVASRTTAGTPGIFVRYFTGMEHDPIISAFDTRAADVPLLTTIAYSGHLVAARAPKP